MTIQVIIDTIFQTRCLTSDQQSQINSCLMSGQATESELTAIDRLNSALLEGSIHLIDPSDQPGSDAA